MMVITGGEFQGKEYSAMIDPVNEIFPRNDNYIATRGICTEHNHNFDAVLVFENHLNNLVYGELTDFSEADLTDYLDQKQQLHIVQKVLDSFVEKIKEKSMDR